MLILTVCCVLCRVFYFENLPDALCIVAASVKNSVHILGGESVGVPGGTTNVVWNSH